MHRAMTRVDVDRMIGIEKRNPVGHHARPVTVGL
jgi:hypothetical protein